MVTFVARDSGVDQVYVRSLMEPRRLQISLEGGYSPIWSGDEIYFRGDEIGGAAPLMVSSIMEEGTRLTASPPHELLRLPFSHLDASPFEVSLDGTRILAITFGGAAQTRDLTVLESWNEDR